MGVAEIAQILKNAVFPRFCVSCNKEGSLLCGDCFAFWQPGAMKIDESDAHIYSWQYADPVARQLICAWKYAYDQSAWEIMRAKLLPTLSTLRHLVHVQKIDAIVPVALHQYRLCERGFDQAVMISEFLGQELDLPVVPIIKRVRQTGKQAERSEQERIKEMKDNPFIISPTSFRSILLIDDVWTTGSTIKAASDLLEKSGVQKVWKYTLVKG
ncbi:MAG: competence protein F [uncultured bacterium]|nr:MAG: competence protein F [uncultured bacterium]